LYSAETPSSATICLATLSELGSLPPVDALRCSIWRTLMFSDGWVTQLAAQAAVDEATKSRSSIAADETRAGAHVVHAAAEKSAAAQKAKHCKEDE
jgi:hypothetical protein